MKSLQLLIFSLGLSFCAAALADINDVFMIEGKIISFDHDVVKAQTSEHDFLEIPKSAIISSFVLSTVPSRVSIPVSTSELSHIKSYRQPSSVVLRDPEITPAKTVKWLKSKVKNTEP